jgi:hypothetical protein
MSKNARLCFFAGMLIILLLFTVLALGGALSLWEPPFVVKNILVK